jgi:hypothetical protein
MSITPKSITNAYYGKVSSNLSEFNQFNQFKPKNKSKREKDTLLILAHRITHLSDKAEPALALEERL